MDSSKKYRFETFLQSPWPFIGWTVFTLYLLLMPGSGGSSWFDRIPHFDKIVHTAIFSAWAFLLLMVWKGRYGESNKKKLSVIVLLLSLIWAITTEWLQSLTDYRTADVLDVAADMCGASIGIAVFFWASTHIFHHTKE